MEEALDAAATNESTIERSSPFIRETIVLTRGRPVLDIKAGATVIEIAEVESQIWKQRLTSANSLLVPNIPAVGRIELANHPRGVDWIGTGWLIGDNIIVTNRHVAEVFGQEDGDGFLFRPGFDGMEMRASIDFLEEFDNTSSLMFSLFKIVHIERGGGPDLAFLRIEPVAGQSLPTPIAITSASVGQGEHVAVNGYPARDPFFPDPDLMDRIFNQRYHKKRLAPGLVTSKSAERIFHDCSTLGGNSGAEVVSLKTGQAVALHFAGTLFTKNHAVPIDLVASRLDDALRGRPAAGPSGRQQRRGEDASPQFMAAVSTGSRVLEATIPLKLRVEIGDIVVSPASAAHLSSAQRRATLDDQADDDLIETTEARSEDYLDRHGYDPLFLGADVNVPLLTLTRNRDDVLTFPFNGGTREVLDYQHFSVLMSAGRRLCRFSACNIDGGGFAVCRFVGSGVAEDPGIAVESG